MSAPTPGPWRLQQNGAGQWCVIGAGELVVCMFPPIVAEIEAEQVANMNVIASALQLLATLKCAEYTVNVTRACLMDSVETHSTHGGWLHQEAMRLDLELDMIRDSITKATGEQP